MGTRSVRLEPGDEERLNRIRRRTGWTASDALKRGLRLLERDVSEKPAAFEIYSELELGPGGYAKGPASQSRETARTIIRRRHER